MGSDAAIAAALQADDERSRPSLLEDVVDAVADTLCGVVHRSASIAQRIKDLGLRGVRQRSPRIVSPRFGAGKEDGVLEATLRRGGCAERRRLRSLIATYGLAEVGVRGDGNCQFRAIAHELYARQSEHTAVRDRVVQQLAREPTRYVGFIEGDFTRYVANVAKDGEWGDHLTLQAAADAYGVQINLLTSYEAEPLIEILPAAELMKSHRILWLTFWAEVHYNAACLPDEAMVFA